MPRPRKFDDDTALAKAKFVFWQRGYEGASLQALEKNMGMNRTSIYNAFGNKRALFDASLKHYMAAELARYVDAIEQAPSLGAAVQGALDEAISLHFDPAHPGGCLIFLSLLERFQHPKKTTEALGGAISGLQQTLVGRFQGAVREGELPPGTDCETKANEVVALISGVMVMAMADMPKEQLQRLAVHAGLQAVS